MIHSFVFDQGRMVGSDLDLDALRIVRGDPGLHVWVDLDQPTPAEVTQVLEHVFSFHPLAIEDCVTVSQLPKIEDYGNYLFLVMHALAYSGEGVFETHELNLFLGKEFMVTYHTVPLRAVQLFCDRVRANPNNGAKGPDRLAHTILDMVVDHYKQTVDDMGLEVETLEDSMFEAKGEEDFMVSAFRMRKDLGKLRAIIRPQAEIVTRLSRGEFKLIRAHLLPYFRDVADHLARYESQAASFSDQLFLVIDVFLNKAQNETNKIIKALTLITIVTTPVMVVGTWYGMNFRPIPELEGPWSYPTALAVMVLSTITLTLWCRRKGWL
jgi:magnesium transporter